MSFVENQRGKAFSTRTVSIVFSNDVRDSPRCSMDFVI
jgi:hypothetical protein